MYKMNYTYKEIIEIVEARFNKSAFKVSDYAFSFIVDECYYHQNEKNRPVEVQLDYIFDEVLTEKEDHEIHYL